MQPVKVESWKTVAFTLYGCHCRGHVSDQFKEEKRETDCFFNQFLRNPIPESLFPDFKWNGGLTRVGVL